MAKASSRAPVLGPAYIRLLARFSAADLPRTPPALTEQLAHWFDWNRAIALSRALDTCAPAATEAAFDAAEAAECARQRGVLQAAIDADIDLSPPRRRDAATGIDPGYRPYRQHCLATQQAMQATTGRLRGRLRDLLATQSPAKARLAEVDAVMDATLSPREQSLLATVPALLGQHYLRLREAGTPDPPRTPGADAPDDSPAAPDAGPWLARFRQDMRTALLAELELRFHPIDGLLAALRTR
ncbi:DUF3348 family protein [Stenotrophomonas mori]|uniref:DUF3348 domain-containing protein n=1 Tax=Stenotrophomonas mori TaxID=2871096 RepID=A0ABT0SHR9_9GAMM|nr:DUF3348 family protein [Stenotrophomonas mori]MCL7714802.1 DUF3348 domain-containing protein [Stenotrophomonas mori]